MIVIHFRQHVRTRLAEWHMAVLLTVWGVVLLWPGATFISSPAFVGLERIADEHTWGMAAFAVGGGRIACLAINGLWRPSYELRALGAFLSLFMWFNIVVGLLALPFLSTAHAVYPTLLVVELMNLYYAALDGRLARLRNDHHGAERRGVRA